MPKTNTVTIEEFKVKKSDLIKVKSFFNVKDNSEAVKMALDMATGYHRRDEEVNELRLTISDLGF